MDDATEQTKRRLKFTKSSISTLPLPPPEQKTGEVWWDTELRGFGVRVFPTGHKVFLVRYRTLAGEQRKPKIGAFGKYTVEDARKEAKKVLARVLAGDDPSRERKAARASATVAEVADDWLKAARAYKKASSIAGDELYLKNYIKPEIGSRKISALDLHDVERLHRKIGEEHPIMANRVLAVVSTVLGHAERNGQRPPGSNVCRLVRRYPERERHRALTDAELQELAKVLDDWPTEPRDVFVNKETGERKKHTRTPEKLAPSEDETEARRKSCDVIRLILMTGCRRSEIAHLKWSEVDREHRVLRLEDSKSGARVVYLNSPALEILERQKATDDNPYVFASPSKDGEPLSDVKRAWRTIRRKAKLGNCRIHDLRHHAGEGLATLGFNEAFISKLLGHKDHSITRRYIDIAASPLHQAAEAYGERVSRAMNGDTNSSKP